MCTPLKVDSDNQKPIIVPVAGGHANVLYEALRQSGREIIGLMDPAKSVALYYFAIKVLGADDGVFNYSPDEVELVNGIVAMPGNNNLRRELNDRMEKRVSIHTSYPSLGSDR
ncbi:MAG: hypothetical protein ABW166_14425 [Sedimenticola sp.]